MIKIMITDEGTRMTNTSMICLYVNRQPHVINTEEWETMNITQHLLKTTKYAEDSYRMNIPQARSRCECNDTVNAMKPQNAHLACEKCGIQFFSTPVMQE